MTKAKEQVRNLIKDLPDDCSFEDIHYHFYLVEKISNSISVAQQNGVIPQEEVEQEIALWLSR